MTLQPTYDIDTFLLDQLWNVAPDLRGRWTYTGFAFKYETSVSASFRGTVATGKSYPSVQKLCNHNEIKQFCLVWCHVHMAAGLFAS